jgi:Tat protein translocase TatB subunit
MFGLGMGEIVVILVVALIVLGPTQLPDAAKSIGKAIRSLRRHTQDLQDTIEKDEQIGGTVRELKSALRGDDYIPREPILPQRQPMPSPSFGAGPAGEQPVAQGEPIAAAAAAPETPAPAGAAAPPVDEAATKNSPPAVDPTRDG